MHRHGRRDGGLRPGQHLLIIAGALVGAAGAILTNLMADAMNRSIGAIIAGGFGTGDEQAGGPAEAGGTVREITVDDSSLQLAYAGKVMDEAGMTARG